ncbi:FGGY carbohydrate kinase domain-containing protein isoform X1 [Pantherophis guttatus]|uniref:FGGY carbohydrate kinase domain-containing protein n=1 Tax=Pantherophis guttatus TaxID=94885 RepID=A0A6P9BT51_PANGU|nr:FGGY carbohydrate kinase domain-containing protein isoform X1 [Pantherophis guttatus]XP_034271087.1 FGGY carbohydrate kinase domain-containing protein isoform X1 [Pantherophis guttatus]XP_060545920.1 FGGY carbohydrate kinase domain-containing protein isoform X1 [Pantherophis guttatus]XP_060545921.1 FGGY carbohydrate kinase domain-containing protein isoform X1 [Pantherophis guttatus]
MQSENLGPVNYYVGIDVGTSSVRAALVDQFGTVVAYADHPIQIWAPQPDYYEQSSDDIWAACCIVTKKITQGINISQIRGLGFDATCSLVVLDSHFQPLAVNSEGEHKRNIIMWMDHRAANQGTRINETQHSVLSFVGGVMSVEMQPPKLLWMKENLRESCWEKAGHFFDLPDFLSWKATGATARSLCTLVCKWTYSSETGWDDNFWKSIGLEDLMANKYSKIGNEVLPPGTPVGNGLTAEAAEDLGLSKGIAVAASLIDAHAGGLGMIGANVKGHNLPCENQPITSRLAVICGTSSCHMAVSKSPVFVPGVWGPYYSAMVPGLWLNEGGQSVTGKLIEHIVQGHAAFPELQTKSEARAQSIYTYLNGHLDLIKKSLPVGLLTVDLHVWPDFHGNRSPLADLTLKGMVVGLTLSQSLDDLALIYLATVQAIALGTRYIVETMQVAGHHINTLFMCGGLSKNPLFVQMHADIIGMPVVLAQEVESVLMGAAILGACASKDFASLQDAMEKMEKIGRIVLPNHKDKRFYDKKYQVFLKLAEDQRKYKSIMQNA